MKQISSIQGYHTHVYFDADSLQAAKTLCDSAVARFGVQMGRIHEKPVGPHPMWSCQLAATPAQFTELLPWLALNRGDLIVFAHPETGNDLEDHRDHGIWLGCGLDLDLSIFD
ncbi:DOPA 4,5-dioxygenase family protein [Pseudophaeobacter sp.]|jgi:DOPA 4,5-dioxygenase|uniref:DOPA 4,5-dioxygenase family protein n=1 Tax=Pseudophaeobacter sp. TaxID=1971739 RepID=UPI0026142003|nr:DOPA 4,5-dioxygenase family protein [Pseudophaeobacter sp.]